MTSLTIFFPYSYLLPLPWYSNAQVQSSLFLWLPYDTHLHTMYANYNPHIPPLIMVFLWLFALHHGTTTTLVVTIMKMMPIQMTSQQISQHDKELGLWAYCTATGFPKDISHKVTALLENIRQVMLLKYCNTLTPGDKNQEALNVFLLQTCVLFLITLFWIFKSHK